MSLGELLSKLQDLPTALVRRYYVHLESQHGGPFLRLPNSRSGRTAILSNVDVVPMSNNYSGKAHTTSDCESLGVMNGEGRLP